MKTHFAALYVYGFWCVAAVACWWFSTAIKRYPVPCKSVFHAEKRFTAVRSNSTTSPLPVTVVQLNCNGDPNLDSLVRQSVENHLSGTVDGIFHLIVDHQIDTELCSRLLSLSPAQIKDYLLAQPFNETAGEYRLIVAARPESFKAEMVFGHNTAALVLLSDQAPLSNQLDEAAATARKTWFRSFKKPTEGTNSLPPALLMSFWLVSDGETRIGWDFHRQVMEPFVYGFLRQLFVLCDLQIQSQVVHHGEIDTIGVIEDTPEGRFRLLRETDLSRFLSLANTWSAGDILIAGSHAPIPTLNLAVYAPALTPTRIFEGRSLLQGFAVPSWGVMAVTEGSILESNGTATSHFVASHSTSNKTIYTLTEHQVKQAVGTWVAHLREQLGLPPTELRDYTLGYDNSLLETQLVSPPSGIATWEGLGLARTAIQEFIKPAIDNLISLCAIIDRLTDLVVEETLAMAVTETVKKLNIAMDHLQQGRTRSAVKSARVAAQDSREVLHDDSLVAETYFSNEFKMALYLPIAMPFFVPIFVAIFRIIRTDAHNKKS
eukprot:Selendium_serpulae@DN6190_c0_g1_i1.p1